MQASENTAQDAYKHHASFKYLKLCKVLWTAAMPHPADELLPRLRSCNEFTQGLESRRGQA